MLRIDWVSKVSLEYYLDGKDGESFAGYSGLQTSYGYGSFGTKTEDNMKTHNDG